ncbi:Putative nuclease HARBI1 [Araneus ventricosus]|uniref:Nuclease HARBI1 n=1 Tax=Araneus ventricosus TaxID=182803 RepID=A0A4Y2VPF3_ARAVE|nr:Putative nuclease HARBI1 [Araneus ventricosus]
MNEETREVPCDLSIESRFFCVISVILAIKKVSVLNFGVSQATVSRTVNAVIDSIIAHANEWIKFPTTNSEITEAKQLWQRKYKFPTAIGVVDCSHIRILKPKLHGDEYINRKGKTTLNVQATCDAKEIFTSVDVSWHGSVHDSRIWKNSQVCLQLRNKGNSVLIGGSGYGIESCLMAPFDCLSNASSLIQNGTD